jgi:hypothetical protein
MKEFIVRKDVEDALGISQSTATRIIREMLGVGLWCQGVAEKIYGIIIHEDDNTVRTSRIFN